MSILNRSHLPMTLRSSMLLGALILGGCESSSTEAGASDDPTGEAEVFLGTDSGASPTDPTDGTPPTSVDVGSPDGSEEEEEPFSFFVTSLEGMRKLSGSNDGFGGDLGGLEGADEICRLLATDVDAGHKTWRAFLSATSGGPNGGPVHAMNRIGSGPWYDRNGRLVAANLEDLIQERPIGDPQTLDDLPNEYGQGQKQYGDNHDTLTGSNAQGMLNSQDPASTCQDWTSAVGPGSEKKVMAGHSWPREQGACGPGGGGPGGPPPGGGEPPKAPPPWIAACQGLDPGDTCNVNGKKAQFEGTCLGHPDDPDLIVCTPPDGVIPGPPPGGGGGGNDGLPWINAHTVPGCAPGVQLVQAGGGQETDIVGGGGGYGGIYCFSLEP